MGSLGSDWLAVEFANIDAEMSDWNQGLKASFDSLFHSAELDVSEVTERRLEVALQIEKTDSQFNTQS